MAKGIVRIHFSNGFGNNLFQYSFGRLLAETHGMKIKHPAIPQLGIEEKRGSLNKRIYTKTIGHSLKKPDTQYHKFFKKPLKKPRNFKTYGFFEDYTLYKPHLKKIRKWFRMVPVTNTKDLVLHLRLNNRLVQHKSLMNQVPASEYIKAFKYFDFDKLYIVTDAKEWRHINTYDVKRLLKKRMKGVKKPFRVAKGRDSKRYMNELVDGLSGFDPIIVNHNKFIKDFDFIRSFDQILFHNSTFAWWAATLSDASKIGVYGPWKPAKGKRNKNLGKTDFAGWFSWGSDAREEYWGHK